MVLSGLKAVSTIQTNGRIMPAANTTSTMKIMAFTQEPRRESSGATATWVWEVPVPEATEAALMGAGLSIAWLISPPPGSAAGAVETSVSMSTITNRMTPMVEA